MFSGVNWKQLACLSVHACGLFVHLCIDIQIPTVFAAISIENLNIY